MMSLSFNTKMGKYVAVSLGFIIILLVVVRLYVARCVVTCLVERSSMNNTLFDGDKVIVDTDGRRNIAINDIVIFRHDDDVFIKRCVGLPGDLLIITDGKVIVDGQSLSSPFTIIPDNAKTPGVNVMTVQQYKSLE